MLLVGAGMREATLLKRRMEGEREVLCKMGICLVCVIYSVQ